MRLALISSPCCIAKTSFNKISLIASLQAARFIENSYFRFPKVTLPCLLQFLVAAWILSIFNWWIFQSLGVVQYRFPIFAINTTQLILVVKILNERQQKIRNDLHLWLCEITWIISVIIAEPTAQYSFLLKISENIDRGNCTVILQFVFSQICFTKFADNNYCRQNLIPQFLALQPKILQLRHLVTDFKRILKPFGDHSAKLDSTLLLICLKPQIH